MRVGPTGGPRKANMRMIFRAQLGTAGLRQKKLKNVPAMRVNKVLTLCSLIKNNKN